MKVNKVNLDRLYLDVADFLFVEWLIRCGYYSRFVDNFFRRNPDYNNTREGIRAYLSRFLRNPSLSLFDAVFSAFLFFDTPEGVDFWKLVDRQWRRFLKRSSINF